jgi:hypothetical protein
MQGAESWADRDYGVESGGRQDSFGYFDAPDYDANWLKSLGYTGAHPNVGMGPDSSDNSQVGNGEFQKWLGDQGLTLGMGLMGRPGVKYDDLLRLQAFDKSGAKVGAEHNWLKDESDPGFGAMMAVMAAFMGNYAGAAAAMGGGEAALGGTSGMDLAADAALGSGNNITTAAGSFGSSGGALGAANGSWDVPGQLGGSNGSWDVAGQVGGGSTGSSPSWLTQLQNGDIAGALSTGGSSVLDWVTSNPTDALKLLGTVGGGLLGGAGSGGSGGGKAYDPKTLSGNFQTSYAPQFQAVQQQTGLLSAPKGQPNSGLWQFMGGGQLPQIDPRQAIPTAPTSPWGY